MNVRVLFVVLVICTFLTTVAQADTLCVKAGKKGCYATISAAASAAASGDTVDVSRPAPTRRWSQLLNR